MSDVTKKPTIKPLDGWTPQTPYGTLKTSRGIDLVRLEDVHAWLMHNRGEPSAAVAPVVFGAFISDGNSELGAKHGAAKVRSHLYITDLSGYAEPIGSFVGSKYLEKAVDQLPHIPHHHFDEGTVEGAIYSLGIVAGEAWAPHVLNTDLNDRLDGYCANGYFPSVAKCREILGHFAVPIRLAHALWGWGEVAGDGSATAVVQLRSVSSDDVEPSNWAELVAFRKKHLQAPWTVAQKKVLSTEFQNRAKKPGATGVAVSMASELPGQHGQKSLSVTAFNDLKRNVNDAGKRNQRAA